MFDRTFISRPSHTSVTAEVSVEEHRAPTDESVRLLKEMQDKIHESVQRALPLEDNTFKGVVYEDITVAGRGAVVVFDLNGKRCTARVVDHYATERGNLIRALHEEMARVIATEVLGDILNKLDRYSRIFR